MKNVITIALTLLLSEAAVAADSDGNYVALSHGTSSCGKVVEAYPKDGLDKLVYSIWVGGYLTAINRHLDHGVNIAKGTDPSARDLWIYNYCQQNPLNSLNDAAYALYRELLNR